MADSFATPQNLADLLAQDVDTARAALLLARASRILRREFPWIDARIADGRLDSLLATDVVTSMAKRALLGPEGVKSETETAGPFTRALSYDNAMGNLYLTAADRALITGHARPGVGSMRLRCDWLHPGGSRPA